MPTYYVTNRTRDGSVEPTSDGAVRLKRSPNDHDANFANFAPVALNTEAAQRRAMNRIMQEAQAMARPGQLPMILVFLHGFNNSTESALHSTALVSQGIALPGSDVNALMLCFDWACNQQLWNYLTDQGDAMRTVPAVLKMLDFLNKYRDPNTCPVSVNLIAHSMGNLVLREGAEAFARRLGYPSLMPYFNEVLMVAADIDADSLNASGTGRGIISLSRRVTVYFSRWDNTLSVSRYVKHLGSARLGRTGPSDYAALPRNVIAVDCTNVVRPEASSQDIINQNLQALFDVHSSYWQNRQWNRDAALTLLSLDRKVISDTREAVPPFQDREFRLLNAAGGSVENDTLLPVVAPGG